MKLCTILVMQSQRDSSSIEEGCWEAVQGENLK